MEKRGGSKTSRMTPQRALRSKKFNPDRKFQSRLEIFNPGSKFSISIENFNPRVSIYGALVVYREGLNRKFQSTIDRSKFSIPKAAIDFFQSPGPLGPLPKRGFGPPSFGTFSIPLYVAALFLCKKRGRTDQTRRSFRGVQKFSGGCIVPTTCSVRFPRYVFLPPAFCPHVMAQSL